MLLVIEILGVFNHQDSVGRGLSTGSKVLIALAALVVVGTVIAVVVRVVSRLGSRRPERDAHPPDSVGR